VERIAWSAPDPKLESIHRLREGVLAAINEVKAHRRRMQKSLDERSGRIEFEVETVTP
jgi:hypothetical protein